MSLSQRLRDRLRAQGWPQQVDHLLQRPATALRFPRANPGGGLWADRRFIIWGHASYMMMMMMMTKMAA